MPAWRPRAHFDATRTVTARRTESHRVRKGAGSVPLRGGLRGGYGRVSPHTPLGNAHPHLHHRRRVLRPRTTHIAVILFSPVSVDLEKDLDVLS